MRTKGIIVKLLDKTGYLQDAVTIIHSFVTIVIVDVVEYIV